MVYQIINVNSNVPTTPNSSSFSSYIYLIWIRMGKLFGNNNPGNISIGLLSTQNKIYILYSLEI